MAIIVPKLTDDRTLGQIHAQLMDDLNEVISDETLVKRHLISISQELGNLEEVMALKWAVDCDCFYTGKDRQ